MRKTAFLLTLTALGLMSLTTTGFAGDGKCDICVTSIPKTHSKPCKVKVCTEVVDRCTVEKKACGPCGKTYCYVVTVITYKDVYSDGTTRIWKSSI
ncbi:MAG: hypothetical protein P1V20_19035 [Verrucomicrobiales bacterium]|nr:hypothetical protein [Verrucomicrobiales bacterium]